MEQRESDYKGNELSEGDAGRAASLTAYMVYVAALHESVFEHAVLGKFLRTEHCLLRPPRTHVT